MSTVHGSALPNPQITDIEYGAPAVADTFNAPFDEVEENLKHLASGQLIVVTTRADLAAHPVGIIGAVPLAFVLDERALYAYDPRTPVATEVSAEGGREGIGGVAAEKTGELAIPASTGKRWVRINADRTLFYSEAATMKTTDLALPTQDLGVSVQIVCDGLLPVEVRLSMDFQGKDGFDGAVELVDGATVIATRDVAEGTQWVEMTKVIIPTPGLHTFTARITHGTTGANPRVLTVRRG